MSLSELFSAIGAVSAIAALFALVFRTGAWHSKVDAHLDAQDKRMDDLEKDMRDRFSRLEAHLMRRRRPSVLGALGALMGANRDR